LVLTIGILGAVIIIAYFLGPLIAIDFIKPFHHIRICFIKAGKFIAACKDLIAQYLNARFHMPFFIGLETVRDIWYVTVIQCHLHKLFIKLFFIPAYKFMYNVFHVVIYDFTPYSAHHFKKLYMAV
jgi:hypothetical protein